MVVSELHTAQLALKMTQIMIGVVPNSPGSSHIGESDDRAVPQVRGVAEEAAVAEVKNRPMVAAAEDNSRRSRTKSAVRRTPSRAKVGHTPKEAAPRGAAAKQAVPKVAAPKPAAKRRGPASLARAKAARRSAKKK
jgi:hypothetical protein